MLILMPQATRGLRTLGGQLAAPGERCGTATPHAGHVLGLHSLLACASYPGVDSCLFHVCIEDFVYKLMLEEWGSNSSRNSRCYNWTWCFALLPNWQAFYLAGRYILTFTHIVYKHTREKKVRWIWANSTTMERTTPTFSRHKML